MGRALRSLSYRIRRLAKRTVYRDGSLRTMWVRQMMNQGLGELLEEVDPRGQRAVEFGRALWADRGWREYEVFGPAEFDLAAPPPSFAAWSSYDVVIADQVLQHVRDPILAARTLVALARPGARVIVSTPFLVKIDPLPGDYWRFSPEGLGILLDAVGLDDVRVWGWGNRRCVAANLRRWTPHRPWRSLANQTKVPLVVWAVGTRPLDVVGAGPTSGESPREESGLATGGAASAAANGS